MFVFELYTSSLEVVQQKLKDIPVEHHLYPWVCDIFWEKMNERADQEREED